MKRLRLMLSLVWVLLTAGLPPSPSLAQSPSLNVSPSLAAPPSQPVLFVQNVGQFAPPADFQMWGAGPGTWWIAGHSLWVSWPLANGTAQTLQMSFIGANPASRPLPFDPQPVVVSYFIGSDPARWRPAVPVWGGIRYADLYPDIDIELSGQWGHLTARLLARPGADLRAVQMRVEEIAPTPRVLKTMGPNANGQLDLPYLSPPASAADTSAVPSLLYSTYIGGSLSDWGYDIAVGADGAAYITGGTQSADFPNTPGAFDGSFNQGVFDAFVIKLNPAGTGLIYATFLGGADDDRGYAIAVDPQGRAYVAGGTNSSNFPTLVGSWDRTLGGVSDAFAVRLNAAGSSLEYATYLGGTDVEKAWDIALGPDGTAYVVGETTSANFPTTAGAYLSPNRGGRDAFLVHLKADGSGAIYSTVLGGGDIDSAMGVAVDKAGAAYVAGFTDSANFPITAGAWDSTYNGSRDAFVAKLNSAGTGLLYATFVGGSTLDEATAIALDGAGCAYLRGLTASRDFPTTPGAFDRTHNGGYMGDDDSFVVKLNAAGAAPVYSTYLGGISFDWGDGIVVDRLGRAYVVVRTESPDYPRTAGAYDTSHNGYWDAALTVLSPDGSQLSYSTFLGGWYIDTGEGIALGSDGSIYLVGATESDNFPTTAGAYDRTCGTDGTCNFDGIWWYKDVFVTRFSPLELRMTYLPLLIKAR